MRKFEQGDKVWYCGQFQEKNDLRKNKNIGIVSSTPTARGGYTVKFSGEPYICQDEHLTLASDDVISKTPNPVPQQPIPDIRAGLTEQKMETNDKLSSYVDMSSIVKNTNAIIQIDVKNAIAYIDSQIAQSEDSMALETELKAWFKDLSTRRLDLTRPVNESLKQVIADEKQIGKYLNKIFADNQAKRDAAEAERKEAKYLDVQTILADMKQSIDLPKEYLDKITFKEEYYQKTMVGKKLKDSIQEQIDAQIALYKAKLNEQELAQQKIRNRELLLSNLNQKYGLNAQYSQFTIEVFSDEQVEQAFIKERKRLDDEEVQKEIPTEAPEVPPVNTACKENADVYGVLLCSHPTSEVHGEPIERFETTSKTEKGKSLTIKLSTGALKSDEVAITKMKEFCNNRLEEMKANFKDKYKIELTYTVE